MSIERCFNVSDFRRIAKKRLPAPMFHYIDGGSDDEWSLKNNSSAFHKYELLPRTLVDISHVDLKTKFLGCETSLPIFLSPTGGTQMFHPGKELAVARAAHKEGLLYGLSTVGTTKLEDLAAETSSPKMFQLYIFKDRELTEELIERCKAAKYQALCLTVDTIVGGNRERDLVTGMSIPPKFTLQSLMSIASKPAWVYKTIRGGKIDIANISHRIDRGASEHASVSARIDEQFDRSLTWEDARWMAEKWGGPFVIKGILTPEDALRARDIGASAVMLSNHGGRQLDCTPAPIDMVAKVRAAVGDDLEIIVDGGIRRGTDVLKALALGANACSIGRPYLYGLAAGGEAGVARVLQLLRDEIIRGASMMGCRSVDEITTDHVQRKS
ncbi:MAG: alpha-hydroxy-acid oxidizing enzyme [Robiginitomaculum sp.]|nr:MAG: alpha-hydroxy-acid oxidizing enzyme [Robiginitomaculum sp.]